jgi:hypothetical protein
MLTTQVQNQEKQPYLSNRYTNWEAFWHFVNKKLSLKDSHKIQGDSYRTGPMNLLIIPQVMHITAHNYDIIIHGPCWVEWCADDQASGSTYAARSRTIPKCVCIITGTSLQKHCSDSRWIYKSGWRRAYLKTVDIFNTCFDHSTTCKLL